MEGSPNQNHRNPMAEKSREEESEINAPLNIPTQMPGGEQENLRPTTIQFSGRRYPPSHADASYRWMRVLQHGVLC